MAENAPRTAGRRLAMLQTVLQPGMGDVQARFEELWKLWEHQVEIYEKPAGSNLDNDVKASVVIREAPLELRDNLLVNSHQFDKQYGQLQTVIQAFLSSNKMLIANDFRFEPELGPSPMDVAYIFRDG